MSQATASKPTAKNGHKKSETGFEAGNFALPLSMSVTMMGSVAAASQSYLNALTELNEELMGFANRRLASTTEAQNSLKDCKTWEEAIQVQQDWMRDAGEQYSEELQRLMELTTRTMSVGLQSLPATK